MGMIVGGIALFALLAFLGMFAFGFLTRNRGVLFLVLVVIALAVTATYRMPG